MSASSKNNPLSDEGLRFLGRHRCPQCRMPLKAEELDCPVCGLRIVYMNRKGEVMVEMISLEDPGDFKDPVVQQYQLALSIEAAGDMYMDAHLPTRPQRATVTRLKDGSLAVGFSNTIAVEDVARLRR
jgi:hypothetical protein